ncbi:hypothetical protein [Streptomyces sp. NPDC093544]|uniref:hypothetical protein n=1 Tax=Streptomyces sp. NPDC093544 TaxID=3155200 RepID=UPI00343B840B
MPGTREHVLRRRSAAGAPVRAMFEDLEPNTGKALAQVTDAGGAEARFAVEAATVARQLGLA